MIPDSLKKKRITDKAIKKIYRTTKKLRKQYCGSLKNRNLRKREILGSEMRTQAFALHSPYQSLTQRTDLKAFLSSWYKNALS